MLRGEATGEKRGGLGGPKRQWKEQMEQYSGKVTGRENSAHINLWMRASKGENPRGRESHYQQIIQKKESLEGRGSTENFTGGNLL